MKSVNIKEMLLIISMMALCIIIIMAASHFENNRRNEIYTLINNPTFRGEVVNTQSISRSRGFSPFRRSTEHRLHIVGEYVYDNETIQVDRVFIVSSTYTTSLT